MEPKQTFPAWLTRQSYWLAAGVPLLVPLGWYLRELPGMGLLFAWVPVLALYGLLPAADWVIGRDVANPDPQSRSRFTDTLIPLVASLAYVLVLPWSLFILASNPSIFGPFALLGWTLSLASVGAIIGINVSHEWIHRREAWQRGVGGFMLAMVWYACFKLEHPRWHHVNVATPRDPSSAPKGANVYRRAPRAWWLNTLCGFRLAHDAAEKKGRALPLVFNEMVGWYALSLAATVAAGLLAGPLVAAVFFAHGLGAALLLEVINFVEHYGLRREQREDGRYVPPDIRHSWDADFWLSNAILLQLPRHADHHTRPTRPYAALQKQSEAPQLPVGYATLVLVALVPPVWRRVMDPIVPGTDWPEQSPSA